MNDFPEHLERLQNLLIAHATGGQADDGEYRKLRQEVIENTRVRDVVPSFLRTCRTLAEFWQFIKSKHQHYAERRSFIWDSFRLIFERIESDKETPADKAVSEAMHKFSADSVHRLWTKAMDRREADPEGAITLARTLLEAVCKHILDERSVIYDSDSDLPALYKAVAKTLNLAPSQHAETIFKQILGGCTAIVEGLGALRNRLSDAHGQGKKPVKPAPRHAELAVNLSGAVAMFLVATHENLPPAATPPGS